VRRDAFGAIRFLIVPTLIFVVALGVVPGRAGLVTRLYALLLCAVLIQLAVKALVKVYPPAQPLRRSAASARRRRRPPESLDRLENESALGVASAFDLHHRLRPRLRRLAAGRLETGHRISLDGDPEAARAALGDTTWELVRADRPPPVDRLARGMPISQLTSVVESLERARPWS